MITLRLPRKLARLLMAVALTSICAPATVFTTFLHPRDRVARIRRASFWCMMWCRGMCRVLGVSVHVTGPRADEAGMTVSNHVSYLDIIALGSLQPTVFVAKSDVGSWPVFGRLARLGGTVFVERASRTASAGALYVVEELLAQGVHVAVFPEGTSTDGSSVAPFKGMFFEAPLRAGLPVKPASVAHSIPGPDKVDIEVAWHGEMSFLPHLWRLLGAGCVTTSISFSGPVWPELEGVRHPRKAFARASRKRVLEGLEYLERRIA